MHAVVVLVRRSFVMLGLLHFNEHADESRTSLQVPVEKVVEKIVTRETPVEVPVDRLVYQVTTAIHRQWLRKTNKSGVIRRQDARVIFDNGSHCRFWKSSFCSHRPCPSPYPDPCPSPYGNETGLGCFCD